MNVDTRIPVVMGGPATSSDAVLVEDGCDMPAAGYALRFTAARAGHGFGCACCSVRGPAADALTRLFRERATGVAPFFNRVVVLASPEGETEIRAALADDAVSRARYRLASGGE